MKLSNGMGRKVSTLKNIAQKLNSILMRHTKCLSVYTDTKIHNRMKE